MKRAFDLFVATICIILSAPLLLACLLAVRLSSPGPIFFRQQRVGQHGCIFEIVKFRTMRVAIPGTAPPQITIGRDPRITPVGAFLRKWKLDELPQLWNVVLGDMSLVGPRPEVPRYVDTYPPAMRDLVLSVRPGITDPCSIRLRNESEILAKADDPERFYVETLLHQKLRISGEYVRNQSLLSDIRILMHTIFAVLHRDKAHYAYDEGHDLTSVCHVISGYFRNDARVFLRQCRSLDNHGFEVSILTNDGSPDEVLDGIRVVNCGKPWSRARTLLMAKRQFLNKALQIDAEIYQLHSPELLPLGLALKKAGKKVVYDAHEDMPRHILEKDWLPLFSRTAISLAFEKYMLHALRKYDDIISPHSHVVADFQARLGKGTLIANFPLVSNNSEFTEADYDARASVLCYSGTVYAYSNQEEVVEALRRFDDVQYRIAGYIDAAHFKRLKAMPAGGKVAALGRLSRPDLNKFYHSARVGVVIYDYKLNLGDRLGSYGTNKIFEYMEAGLPFICTDYILWKDIVDRYDCGVCVAPGRPSDIAAAINYLLRDSERAYRMGQNGRKAVLKEFNWTSEEAKYVELFRRLAGHAELDDIT